MTATTPSAQKEQEDVMHTLKCAFVIMLIVFGIGIAMQGDVIKERVIALQGEVATRDDVFNATRDAFFEAKNQSVPSIVILCLLILILILIIDIFDFMVNVTTSARLEKIDKLIARLERAEKAKKGKTEG